MLANTKIKLPTFSRISVPNTGILLAAANPRRFYMLIVNTSNTDAWLMYGSQNAVGDGIFLAANGFAFEMTKDNLWQGEIYAIHGGSGLKQINVLEGQ